MYALQQMVALKKLKLGIKRWQNSNLFNFSYKNYIILFLYPLEIREKSLEFLKILDGLKEFALSVFVCRLKIIPNKVLWFVMIVEFEIELKMIFHNSHNYILRVMYKSSIANWEIQMKYCAKSEQNENMHGAVCRYK